MIARLGLLAKTIFEEKGHFGMVDHCCDAKLNLNVEQGRPCAKASRASYMANQNRRPKWLTTNSPAGTEQPSSV